MLSRLSEMQVNILSIDSVIAGYNLLIFNAICEMPSLSQWVREQLRTLDDEIDRLANDRPVNFHESRETVRRKTFRDIGVAMMACLTAIRTRLRTSDSSYRQVGDEENRENWPFLHDGTATLGSAPWFLRAADLKLDTLTDYASQFGLLPCEGNVGIPTLKGANSIKELLEVYLTSTVRATRAADQGAFEQQQAIDRLKSGEPGLLQQVLEFWQGHRQHAVSTRAATTLAYARIWRHEGTTPIQFLFHENQRLLMPCVDGKPHGGLLQEQFKNLCKLDASDLQLEEQRKQLREELDESPTLLASFNRSEKSLRLRLLRGWFAREFALFVDIRYQVRSRSSKSRAAHGWHGLMHSASYALEEESLLIERVANAILESTPEQERGQMLFTVVPDGHAATRLHEQDCSCWKTDADRADLAQKLESAVRDYAKHKRHYKLESLKVEVRSLGHAVESRY